jgi:3-methyladenine DNA glycosylase AlkD
VTRAAAEVVLARLESMGDPANVAGMRRFGITPRTRLLGIPVPALRSLARELGRDHRLAGGLWRSGIHEARVLATMVEDPGRVTEAQADRWVRSLDSWDVCDQLCSNLLSDTAFAFDKAREWAGREREFEKRAGFALMAALTVHAKNAPDRSFERFLPLIRREATDDRNFVRKAVNWALRQIGKRNPRLHAAAIDTAERIGRMDSRAARWIASDALRELRSEAVRTRLARPSRPRATSPARSSRGRSTARGATARRS